MKSAYFSQGRSRRRFSPRALTISVAAAAIVVLLGFVLHLRFLMDARSNLIQEQERAVSEQRYALRNELNNVADSAAALAQIAAGYMRPSPDGGKLLPDPILKTEFLNFARTRGGIEQLRMIDASGREIVNIKRIRARSGTYYFRDTSPETARNLVGESWVRELLALPAGEHFVSGREWKTDAVGKLVDPAVPLLMVGVALPSEKGRSPMGYVLVDYPIERIFQRLAKLDQYLKSDTLITDSDGDWVREANLGMAAAPDSPSVREPTLAATHPLVWEEVLRNATGVISQPEGIFVFDTLNPQEGGPVSALGAQSSWKILTWLTPEIIAAREKEAAVPVWWWVILAVGLVMPVTYLMVNDRELKREASRLKEQARALLESIANSSVDGIVAGEAVRNAKRDIVGFRVAFSNPASAEILKTFPAAKSDVSEEFPLFFSSDFFAQCVQVVVTGSRFETEQNTECESGRSWFRIVVVKFADGVVLTFSDMTRQKFAVHELRQAKETAEVANRAKSQFLTMMGHEIRTPMHGLLGFAGLLEKTNLTAEQTDYVSTLRLSGEALLHILDDILDYSHMESESLDVQSKPVEIKELVTQVNQLFVMALGDRKLELVTRISDDVPVQILSDDVRLRQILVNLVGNALKFTEEGFLLIKVVVENTAKGDMIVFHVVDSGPGVSGEMIDRLFKPFSQVDGTFSRRFGGTGLGLSICKRLVETMGGQIGVNTAPGKGSDFHFSLPLKTPEFSSIPGLSSPAFLSANGASLRVLVVDDDAINRKLIRRMLEKVGATVEVAESGLAAIENFRRTAFDLIFMDLQMPGMDGLETTLQIREIEAQTGREHRTPISALTANAGEENRRQCLNSGMDDFLTKPVTMVDLETLLLRVDAATRG